MFDDRAYADERENEMPEGNDLSDVQASALDQWVSKSPHRRRLEVNFLRNAGLRFPMEVTAEGDLHQVFSVGECVFLMALDRDYPRIKEDQSLPIRVCLVIPNVADLIKQYPFSNIPCVVRDHSGVEFLYSEGIEDIFKNYLYGLYDGPMTEVMLQFTTNWVDRMDRIIKKSRSRFGRILSQREKPLFDFGRQLLLDQSFCGNSETRSKYTDGRMSVTGSFNPRCQKIILSDRAFIQIYNESQSRIQTETGGLLLGHFDNGVWYVVEASDPGINAKFHNAYHEGDDVYENHVCGVISRTYKHPLVFLGMWHRHPGSFDSFSGTDDNTNYKYAGSAGNGCISAIINFDPEFRITFYYVEQGQVQNVYYTRVDVEVGDDKFTNRELLKIASMEDVNQRQH